MPAGGFRVGGPSVGHDGAAGLDIVEQELLQALGAGVPNDAQPSADKTPGAVEFHGGSEQAPCPTRRALGCLLLGPPKKASSTSTSPVSRSQPGRTMTDR